MNIHKRILSAQADAQARTAYQDLFLTAMPGSGGIAPERIEVATFNCSETMDEFRQIGLGLETVVIYRAADGSGHTGKVLLNLPGQLLPEHGHVDTYVLEKSGCVPAGFVPLTELINNFKGVAQYNSDGTMIMKNGCPDYRYTADDYWIVQARDGLRSLPAGHPGVLAVYPGKSETFKTVYGDGVLFADTAEVLYAPPGCDPDFIPAELRSQAERIRAEQCITTSRMIYMTRGMNVLLAKNTRHALLGGSGGCVYFEFSTPSMDEADRFTDPRIIR